MYGTLFYAFSALAFVGNGVLANSGEYPAGNLLPRMSLPKNKRVVSATSDLIPVVPATLALPAVNVGDNIKHHGRAAAVFNHKRAPQVNAAADTATCPNASYSLCQSGKTCCPTGGLCCNNGDCCDQGYKCCSAGDCCPSTHTCVTIAGTSGCCPAGQTCSANGTQCADAGYKICAGENFCCRPGDKCYRDAAGQAKCGSAETTSAAATKSADQTPSGLIAITFASGVSATKSSTVSVAPTTSQAAATPTTTTIPATTQTTTQQETSATPTTQVVPVTTTVPVTNNIPTTMTGVSITAFSAGTSTRPVTTLRASATDALPTGGAGALGVNGGLMAAAIVAVNVVLFR